MKSERAAPDEMKRFLEWNIPNRSKSMKTENSK